MTPFAKRTAEEREALLLRLGTSRFPHQRMMFNGFKRVFLSIAGSVTMKGKDGAAATNPLWQLASYPGMAPVHALPPAAPLPVHPSEAMPSEEDSSDRADVSNDCIECDVLVIGSGAGDSSPKPYCRVSRASPCSNTLIFVSGAGGGVAAAVLAKAGLKVIVLEKGMYVPPKSLGGSEREAFGKMYEKVNSITASNPSQSQPSPAVPSRQPSPAVDTHTHRAPLTARGGRLFVSQGGLLATDDGAIPVLAGATLGGGTTINWACCVPTPETVRAEWAQEHGLHQFAPSSAEFDASLAAVLDPISIR